MHAQAALRARASSVETEWNMSLDSPETRFLVVVNDEEQYSLWPDYKEIPQGWRTAGKQGSKEECLAYIESVWTDMRPLSLRQAMQAQDRG
jgi:MbtH protein